MHALEISHIAKSFGATQAVVDVSFEVEPGEIFGLLGPNGAGKTTSIRILLDLFKPDRGSVSILGGPMTEEKKNRIGYMPEERGLYQDISLERCLLSAALTYLTVYFSLRLAAAMFHAQNLLSGQPFSIRRYIRAFHDAPVLQAK